MIALNQFRNDVHRPPDASDPFTPGRVYMAYFQFKCPPFAITPDPEFLFLSETHRNAIEKIQYGIQSRQGFMLLTGEVGTGKSTLCRVMLDLLQADAQTVYIINPSLSGRELIATILDDLGVARSGEASKKTLIDQLNAYLLANARTRPVVIIIDDAQTMSSETLEDMRLLSNLETDKEKLLQVLLVGQPELLDQIEQPAMRQLRQRIAVNGRLDFLKIDEVGRYIERRLFIAGNHAQARFTPRLVKQIHKKSQGVPRLINKICDLALTAAYTADTCVVDVAHLTIAKEEIVDLMPREKRSDAHRSGTSGCFHKDPRGGLQPGRGVGAGRRRILVHERAAGWRRRRIPIEAGGTLCGRPGSACVPTACYAGRQRAPSIVNIRGGRAPCGRLYFAIGLLYDA